MSWNKELWVDVSLIQSAPHSAAQYTACVLIVQYAFLSMHNCFCSRIPRSSSSSSWGGESPACELIHTKFLCAARKQVCILRPAITAHTWTQPVLSVHTHKTCTYLFAFGHSGRSRLSVFTTNIICLMLWADLCRPLSRACARARVCLQASINCTFQLIKLSIISKKLLINT